MNEENEPKISRNAPCPCGSGKKYKMCCGAKIVAAERLREEQRNPNWTPDGVAAERDDTPGTWLNDRPKWKMRLIIEKNGTAEGDAERVINGLLRPYQERFCARDMQSYEKDDQFEVAILQVVCHRQNEPISTCPAVLLAKYSEMWNVFKARLTEFFDYFCDSNYDCEVRWDQGQGGPILTLTDDEGCMEQFFVARPDRFA